MNTLSSAAVGMLLPFLMTTLGAAMVFFFRKEVKAGIQRVFFGVCRRCHDRRIGLGIAGPGN